MTRGPAYLAAGAGATFFFAAAAFVAAAFAAATFAAAAFAAATFSAAATHSTGFDPPIGLPTLNVVVLANATPGTRNAAASDRAGYVAVTVPTVPTFAP